MRAWRVAGLLMQEHKDPPGETTMTVTIRRVRDGREELREITIPISEASDALWRAYEQNAVVSLVQPRPQLWRDGMRLL